MLLLLACTLAVAAATPLKFEHEELKKYDQRQDGEFNVQADLQNILIIVGLPKKMPTGLLELLMKSSKSGDQSIAQDRADVTLDAFVEPSTPYRVIIGPEGERTVEADNAIVIAGRRRVEAEADAQEEVKLIGATEQCGPDRRRDPVTLMCKSVFELRDAKPELENAPEVVPT